MVPFEKMEEIKQALVALGFPESVTYVAVELDDIRAKVFLDSAVFGVYDFVKHTFVD